MYVVDANNIREMVLYAFSFEFNQIPLFYFMYAYI